MVPSSALPFSMCISVSDYFVSNGYCAPCWTFLDRFNTNDQLCPAAIYRLRSISIRDPTSRSLSALASLQMVGGNSGPVRWPSNSHNIYEAYAHKKAHSIMDLRLYIRLLYIMRKNTHTNVYLYSRKFRFVSLKGGEYIVRIYILMMSFMHLCLRLFVFWKCFFLYDTLWGI